MATKKYEYYTKAITCPSGKRKYIRGKTKKELEQKVRAAQRELQSGVDISDNTTFAELTQKWIDVYKRPTLRENSLNNLLGMLNHHVIPYLGEKRVRDIKATQIAEVVYQHGYDYKCTNDVLLSRIRTIFKFAIDCGIITKSPVPLLMKPKGSTTRDEAPFTKEQSKQLLSYLAKRKDCPTSSYLFTLIANTTGMRRGEILGLTWDCIDFEKEIIDVKQQLVLSKDEGSVTLTPILKTDYSYRQLPMTRELKKELALEKLRGKSKYCVCNKEGGPINTTRYVTFTKQWEKASEKLKLGHVHAHRFRHSYATWLVASGMDPKQVQYLMGHKDLDMTLGLYAHYQADVRRAETNQQVKEITGELFAV